VGGAAHPRAIISLGGSGPSCWRPDEKFFLPTLILESRNYNKIAKDGVRHPFEQKALVICSFHFAARHAKEPMVIPCDLVVIDEAHRLRNVYRPGNRIGKALEGALANAPKVLLIATPR
jgi:hypothetical protein